MTNLINGYIKILIKSYFFNVDNCQVIMKNMNAVALHNTVLSLGLEQKTTYESLHLYLHSTRLTLCLCFCFCDSNNDLMSSKLSKQLQKGVILRNKKLSF